MKPFLVTVYKQVNCFHQLHSLEALATWPAIPFHLYKVLKVIIRERTVQALSTGTGNRFIVCYPYPLFPSFAIIFFFTILDKFLFQ